MATILRILNKFYIKNQGMVYTTKNESYPNTFKIDDIFFDLQGNRFKIKGIEMIKLANVTNISLDTTGVMLEALDNCEVQGQLLVSEPAAIHFLFCNHPLYSKQVDEDYKEEFDLCSQNFSCGLFSYEDMERNQLSLYGKQIEGLTIYRGWMMKPEMYSAFYEKLKEKNIILINSPEEYNYYHLLPHWYKDFEQDTAVSFWTKGADIPAAFSLLNNFDGAVMVKDYVKSRKHEWYDACFIPDVSDRKNASQVIQNFVTRQGDGLVGGIVIRKFLELNSTGCHPISHMPISEEYRAFVLAGNILLVDDYWKEGNVPSFSLEDQQWIDAQLEKIKGNFVTMDFARTADGKLVIMELGDGQVSGLQQIPVGEFYNKFCMKFLCNF